METFVGKFLDWADRLLPTPVKLLVATVVVVAATYAITKTLVTPLAAAFGASIVAVAAVVGFLDHFRRSFIASTKATTAPEAAKIASGPVSFGVTVLATLTLGVLIGWSWQGELTEQRDRALANASCAWNVYVSNEAKPVSECSVSDLVFPALAAAALSKFESLDESAVEMLRTAARRADTEDAGFNERAVTAAAAAITQYLDTFTNGYCEECPRGTRSEEAVSLRREYEDRLDLLRRRPIGSIFNEGCAGCPTMVVTPPRSGLRPQDQAEADPLSDRLVQWPFAIAVFEASRAEWAACVNRGNCPSLSYYENGDVEEMPVTDVSYRQVEKYTEYLNEVTSNGAYRLPTAEEWEYAARANSTDPFAAPPGANLCEYTNLLDLTTQNSRAHRCNDRFGRIAPATPYLSAGELNRLQMRSAYPANLPRQPFRPNAWGIYHMLGNVREIVEEQDGNSVSVVTRAGSFLDSPQTQVKLEISTIAPLTQGDDYANVGFRLVRDLRPDHNSRLTFDRSASPR